jgi:hypothetical protein
VLDAAQERDARAQEARAWLAWSTANLQRAKRLPAYRQFVRRPPPPATAAELARRRAEHAELGRRYHEYERSHPGAR